MRRFRKYQRRILVTFFGGLLAITFLVCPVLADEMTSEEKLKKAEELAIKASEIAPRAKETGSVESAQRALRLANAASILLSEIVSTARDTGDTELAQAVMNALNNLAPAINQVVEAAFYIIRNSTDSSMVNAAKVVLGEVEEIQNQNVATIDTAFTAGAVLGPSDAYESSEASPFEIPVQEEPPIQDVEPASPI